MFSVTLGIFLGGQSEIIKGSCRPAVNTIVMNFLNFDLFEFDMAAPNKTEEMSNSDCKMCQDTIPRGCIWMDYQAVFGDHS